MKATEGLRKESDKLKKVADEGMRRVKELGNVQNWAEMLERDFLVLGETLRLVERGSESEGSSYTGSEWETSSEGSRDEEGGREPAIALDEEGERQGKNMDLNKGLLGTLPLETQTQRAVDADGDTKMHDTENENQDKGKGKAVEVLVDTAAEEQAAPTAGGSSTATATTGSTSDPSSSSVRTAASVAS